jgi:hypothetical protein
MLRKLILAASVALPLLAPAHAAGIDSRAYTCPALHGLVEHAVGHEGASVDPGVLRGCHAGRARGE